MGYSTIKCPNCQSSTPTDTDRKQCYCIYCGFRYDIDSSLKLSSTNEEIDDGKVNVTFATSMADFTYTVEIDGKEVCVIAGASSETVRVEPGKHTIHAKANSFVGGEITGELKEGTKVESVPDF